MGTVAVACLAARAVSRCRSDDYVGFAFEEPHHGLARIQGFHLGVFNDETYLFPFHVSELSQPLPQPFQHGSKAAPRGEHPNARLL